MTYSVANTSYMYLSILVGAIIAIGMSWFSIRLSRRINLVDIPGSAPHKKHARPTPLAGGIAIFGTLILVMTIFGTWKNPNLSAMILSAGIIFILGLVDDLRHLSPSLKILGQILAVLLLIFSGIHIRVLEYGEFYLGGPKPMYVILDYMLTIFWVIGVTNAFNLVDSMDGLAVGLSAFAFAFFMLATYASQQMEIALLSAILLGICVGVYYYNAAPARMFLGDSGAQTLGFLLAVIAIIYTPAAALQASSWFVPILLVGVPIFDTTLVVFSRSRRKVHFYESNLDHTYHRLVKIGLDPNHAVYIMHLAALLLGCIAFWAVSLPSFYANIIFLLCILLGGIGIYYLDYVIFHKS